MKVDVVNIEGKKVQSVDLPAKIFEAPVNTSLMHQAYVRQIANARLGTHKTKTRSEVSGGGRKPWRQKGTGRARQGSIRAPQWVGGGGVHTPRPRDYSQKMPRKMRRAALRSALSVKAADQEILILDEIALSEPKTREMAQVKNNLAGESSVLLIIPEKNEIFDQIHKAANNIPDVKLLNANYMNIRDLLGFEKVIIPLAALEVIESYLG
ncbi:MAG: 50S ribosomal protein L4 [Chloroflexota bacterium]|nr:MAG: 50S ribosomal protein L4 [Chloroflexota bacterium]